MSAFRTAAASLVAFASVAVASSSFAASTPYQTKPAAAKPAAAAPAKPVAAPVPAPKALPPEIAGECAWVGKRVISLLARDDVEQAGRFLAFYRDFGCRESHLGPTFRCVIMGDETPAPATSGEDTFTARVDRCWGRD